MTKKPLTSGIFFIPIILTCRLVVFRCSVSRDDIGQQELELDLAPRTS